VEVVELDFGVSERLVHRAKIVIGTALLVLSAVCGAIGVLTLLAAANGRLTADYWLCANIGLFSFIPMTMGTLVIGISSADATQRINCEAAHVEYFITTRVAQLRQWLDDKTKQKAVSNLSQ
jgi:hypothetical protein